MDLQDTSELIQRKLERNGVCSNGYDLMKGVGIGYMLSRVSYLMEINFEAIF